MSPVELVLSRLEKVHSHGRLRWTARCPAHADRTPSLSIREADDGKVLLHCFAGCETEDVVQAIGLGMADLFVHGDDTSQHPSTPPWHTARKAGDAGPPAPLRPGRHQAPTPATAHPPIDPVFGFNASESMEIATYGCTRAYLLCDHVAHGGVLTDEELNELGNIARRLLVVRHFFEVHPPH